MENIMSIIKNLLTFGAYGRIEDSMKEYNKVKNRYNSRLHEMKSKSHEVNAVLEAVVRVKVEALNNLNSFKEFSVDNIEGSLSNSHKFKSPDFRQINQTLQNGQLALTATAGAVVGTTAGVGTALATWGLVSTFGAASTGTAISTLSGAAATNATLALLGGGAVAAGGGGIIAGVTVLGGIVAIPALVALGVFSHFSAKKKVAEIESAIRKMQRHMYRIEKNIIRLKEIKKRSNKLIRLIKRKSKNLKYELNISTRIIDGEMNKFTSFYHQIRRVILRRNTLKLASEVSVLIETPIFNEDTEKVLINKVASRNKGPIYKMLAGFIIMLAVYIFAMPFLKNTSLHSISQIDWVNNLTDNVKQVVIFIDEEKNGNLTSTNNINEPEEEINQQLIEDNVVSIIVTKNYGETEILNVELIFIPGETMNEVLQKHKDELELEVKDNRIFSIKGVKHNLNGSERWLAQITDVDGFPVDSISSELKNGDVIELDLH